MPRTSRPLKKVSLAVALLSSSAGFAQATHERYLSVTPENFDSGGDISLQFHLHAESYKRSATIAAKSDSYPLAVNLRADLAQQPLNLGGETSPFAEYVATDPYLDSVVIVHNGVIVFEAYPRMQPWQRHYAWSVTKVLTSAIVATLVADGRVDMDAPIERYVPGLNNSAWAGTSIRDISNMASGIDCRDSDGYQDTGTCVYRMEESLNITAPTGAPVAFPEHLQTMKRLRPAGTRNEYVSANTNVLMLLIESVTGSSFADAARERIWARIGAEADALISVSAEGFAFASGGLSARLRDVARFGMVFSDKRRFPDVADTMIAELRRGGGIVLPPDSLESLAQQYGNDRPTRAGWQWDQIWDDGAVYKSGYLGQGLYVDPDRQLIVAWFGTGIDYDEEATAMPVVARQLAVSGLFDNAAASAASIEASIEANNTAYEKAYAARDMAALMALHDDDLVFIASHRERIVGKDALAEALAEEFSQGISGISLSTEEITQRGDLAIELGRYQLYEDKGSDRSLLDAGDYVVVWKQDNEGRWRIYRDVTSSTLPPP
jgi:CubicO group peptidase (beta-lactamase class C family)